MCLSSNTFFSTTKVNFSFVRDSAILFHFILSNYGECYQKERNVKYVWSAQLSEKVPSLRQQSWYGTSKSGIYWEPMWDTSSLTFLVQYLEKKTETQKKKEITLVRWRPIIIWRRRFSCTGGREKLHLWKVVAMKKYNFAFSVWWMALHTTFF